MKFDFLYFVSGDDCLSFPCFQSISQSVSRSIGLLPRKVFHPYQDCCLGNSNSNEEKRFLWLINLSIHKGDKRWMIRSSCTNNHHHHIIDVVVVVVVGLVVIEWMNEYVVLCCVEMKVLSLLMTMYKNKNGIALMAKGKKVYYHSYSLSFNCNDNLLVI